MSFVPLVAFVPVLRYLSKAASLSSNLLYTCLLGLFYPKEQLSEVADKSSGSEKCECFFLGISASEQNTSWHF